MKRKALQPRLFGTAEPGAFTAAPGAALADDGPYIAVDPGTSFHRPRGYAQCGNNNDTGKGRAQNRRVEFEATNAPTRIKVLNQAAAATSTDAALRGRQPTAGKKRHRSQEEACATERFSDAIGRMMQNEGGRSILRLLIGDGFLAGSRIAGETIL